MARKMCPACGASNEMKARTCTACGATLRKRHRGPAHARTARTGERRGLLYGLLDLLPGLTHPKVLAWGAVMMVFAVGFGFLALKCLTLNLLPATLLAGVLAMVFYCTVLTWLLYGYVCVPSEAVVEFDGRQWLLMIGLTVLPIAVIAGLPGG